MDCISDAERRLLREEQELLDRVADLATMPGRLDRGALDAALLDRAPVRAAPVRCTLRARVPRPRQRSEA